MLIHGRYNLGRCSINLDEIPKNVPPNCKSPPRWVRLHDTIDDKVIEILLAVYRGDESDKQYSPDALSTTGSYALENIVSELYLTPQLWYLRVTVIGVDDLIQGISIDPRFYARVCLGNQTLKTRKSRSSHPVWNQDLVFVAAEPFDDLLIISLEDLMPSSSAPFTVVGTCFIPWNLIEKRHVDVEREQEVIVNSLATGNPPQAVGTIFVKACLERGYNVQYESANYISDFRPSDSNLWKPKIGFLELAILRATSLVPRDCQQTTSAYSVAKYGNKWFRTSTVAHSSAPEWNQVFRWEVFDPYTVVTVGVFDSWQDKDDKAEDSRLGKVRIRLSTLRTGQVYTLSYPLLVIHPHGVKKMGEIDLAVRFTCSSWIRLMSTYTQSLLPERHSTHRLTFLDTEPLRREAAELVSMSLALSEPPLKKEVVDYMLNMESHTWSVRRMTVNSARILRIVSGSWDFIDDIFTWKSTPKSVFICFCILVCIFWPDMVLAFLPFLIFFTGLGLYFRSSDLPPHMNIPFSKATGEIETEEEVDTYPLQPDVLSVRYDSLRRRAGIIQTAFGNISAMMERLFFLLSWQDRRATALFLVFSLVSGTILVLLWLASGYLYSRYMYHVPLSKVLQLLAASYLMWFRELKLLSWVFNFFWRLPAGHDYLV